jgi:hypothetical protein
MIFDNKWAVFDNIIGFLIISCPVLIIYGSGGMNRTGARAYFRGYLQGRGWIFKE